MPIPKISAFAKALPASPTMSMDSAAKDLIAAGKKVLSFALGEPDFPTPSHICEAAKIALDKGQTKYTPAAGTPALREAIVAATERDLGLKYTPDQVVVSNGGKHALMNVWRTLLDPGDEVIIFAPYWVSYPVQIEMACGVAVKVVTSGANDFQPDLDEVRAKITDRTVGILINSPSNPTGGVFEKEIIEGLAAIAQEHDLTIISDEIYKHILFDGRKHTSTAQFGDDLQARTILVDGVAKTYAMTGWRIGWMIAPPAFAKQAGNIQSQETSNPCSISQAATVAALLGPQDSVEEMRKAFEERRNAIVPALNAIPGIVCPNPGGAFYVFPNISALTDGRLGDGTVTDSESFCTYLLAKANVSTVHGSASGTEGYFRISFACSMAQIMQGVEQIAEAVK